MSPEPTPRRGNNDPYKNRRQWTRFRGTDEQVTVCLQDGRVLDAKVCDESFGGIGLYMTSVEGLRILAEVEVNYNGAPMKAEVRRIEPAPGGIYKVGLLWWSVKQSLPGNSPLQTAEIQPDVSTAETALG